MGGGPRLGAGGAHLATRSSVACEVLFIAVMRLASLLVPVAVAATTAEAGAGGYVAAGVGSSPNLGGELEDSLDTDGRNAGRLAIGHRVGVASVEAVVGGFGVGGVAPNGEWIDGTAVTAALAVKLQVGIVGRLDGYGRGGLQRTWVRSDMMESLSGSGYVLGVGLDYGLPLLVADAGVWLELGRETLRLSQAAGSVSGTADTLLAGVRVGL
jgi:hypothetical protein